jgi:hypothetical protein
MDPGLAPVPAEDAATAARSTRSSSVAMARSETEEIVMPHGASTTGDTATALGAA